VANVFLVLALKLMKAKRATVIFLSQLAICNLVHCIAFLFRGIFFLWHVNTIQGCLFMQVFVIGATGNYMIGIFYIYLDLFISLKKMSVNKPIISGRIALIMSIISGVVCLGFGAIGYTMRNVSYKYTYQVGCSIHSGVYTKEYVLILTIFGFVTLLGIVVCHILIYRLIKKAQFRQSVVVSYERRNIVSTISGTATNHGITKTTRWLNKNEATLKMIILVLILFVVCFYPINIITLIIFYCKTCSKDAIHEEVFYVGYLLVVVHYISNGVIYAVKIKEFKYACRNICCIKLPFQIQVQPSSINVSSDVE